MPNPYGWGQNEPQIKPKDQGGDSISTFAAKIKDAITSLFNTLNSYPWSNATQSDSGYMSKEDKIALDNVPSTYLPLSGGTLTGVTNAPTPATTDNSTKIATTAFVNLFAVGKDVQYWQLNSDSSRTFDMIGGSAVVIARRNAYSAILVFDEWNSAPIFIAEQLGFAPRPITGSQTGGKITLTNNGNYGALKLIILAGAQV